MKFIYLVSNISITSTTKDVILAFRRYKPIDIILLSDSRGQSLGVFLIELEEKHDNKSILLNGEPISIENINEDFSKTKIDGYQIYVNNIENFDNLNQIFSDFGEILEIKRPDKNQNYCFIKYKTINECIKAVKEANGIIQNQNPLKVRVAFDAFSQESSLIVPDQNHHETCVIEGINSYGYESNEEFISDFKELLREQFICVKSLSLQNTTLKLTLDKSDIEKIKYLFDRKWFNGKWVRVFV